MMNMEEFCDGLKARMTRFNKLGNDELMKLLNSTTESLKREFIRMNQLEDLGSPLPDCMCENFAEAFNDGAALFAVLHMRFARSKALKQANFEEFADKPAVEGQKPVEECKDRPCPYDEGFVCRASVCDGNCPKYRGEDYCPPPCVYNELSPCMNDKRTAKACDPECESLPEDPSGKVCRYNLDMPDYVCKKPECTPYCGMQYDVKLRVEKPVKVPDKKSAKRRKKA